ncbi:aminopeptidase P family protein [Borrelia miyamotoi]|uniref:Aminopeptidase family protein P n=1 Tax=Borrelia miyamotoi TaxID=47466 RepID=A0AAX3JML1_9SPIR|nr:aminopeptidase P family protein [Borrelia miyamotoi]QFP42227.1 aminopeptidase P family protein [Borrelia miyamotoi]QFP48341.1 aminopeptidase P family protein [Borrelia miyamotoi]QGT56101.1 M24 family metallopeptidase [Borrelia miyamotoi]QGT56881.1 M24 family metallopeptidase [Borrelia miyamotoi]WAZ72147.1 aminopeptidase family protein P [Borrelia miyamotoi]
MEISTKISYLRNLMMKSGVYAYLVTSYDPHMSEYSHARFNVREFITGFTGSSGTVIVTETDAVLFTDGRYFLQASREIEGTEFKLMKLGVKGYPDIFSYINANLKGLRLGIYAEDISVNFYNDLVKNCRNTDIEILHEDLISKIWEDRPNLKGRTIFELSRIERNDKRIDKINKVHEILKEKRVDFCIISSLDEIAWLLNLRGLDIESSALFYAFLFIARSERHKNILFVSVDKLDSNLKERLEIESFEIEDYSNFYSFLAEIKHEGKFFISVDSNVKILESIGESNTILGRSIVNELKAIKSDYEISSIKEAHVIDAVSLIKFLFRFKSLSKDALSELDEVDVSNMLLDFRSAREEFFSSSFGSIVGFKENAALPHYSPKKGGAKRFDDNGLLLIDSGGSYFELGTTDVTRTILIGEASYEEKEDYTLVLKSFIALVSLKFPFGTSGASLDGIARFPLLKQGLNFAHGTGHGVGFFLNVHELPVSISPFSTYSFKGSEIVSIEPGIYRNSKYGIRIENLVCVKQSYSNEFGTFLEFENLTLVPFEKELIVAEMLSKDELQYVNSYHEVVYLSLKEYLSGDELKFLETLTSKI